MIYYEIPRGPVFEAEGYKKEKEKEKELMALKQYISTMGRGTLERLTLDLLCERFEIPIKTQNADLFRLWESIGSEL